MKRLVLLLALLSCSAYGEMEKFALPCTSSPNICFFWWPKLPAVTGWHHERNQSYNISANALAPDGSTFVDAETVMYAEALYKPRIPDTKSLEVLIDDDKKKFRTSTPGVLISEVAPLTTADGQKLRSLTFFPTAKGNWERVSYGEEGEFYLVFTISSRSKAGYDKAMLAYESLIHAYKEKF